MFPTSFKQSNGFLEPPKGISPKVIESIAVCHGRVQSGEDKAPIVLSCWKPTQEELDKINKTKRVWLHVMGDSMPPVLLSGMNPFEEK